jgi:hypothetical protein
VVGVEHRQVFQLPVAGAHVTEHGMERLRGSCGVRDKSKPLARATAPGWRLAGARAVTTSVPGGPGPRLLRIDCGINGANIPIDGGLLGTL